MTQTVGAIDLVEGGMRIGGLAAMAGLASCAFAIGYRWYVQERMSTGLAVLLGGAVVAIYLNTTTALGQVIGGVSGVLNPETALINSIIFVVAGLGAVAGGRIGDRAAQVLTGAHGAGLGDGDVGKLVRAVGRVVAVTLPEEVDEIEDIEGYEPVPDTAKAELAGKTLVFPRGLTVEELRDRLVARVKEDYGIGHVGVELADDGSVEYFAVGSRLKGIGPTLAPGTAATAIRADPPTDATPGDLVQVRRGDGTGERVASAELRAAGTDTATLALDEMEATALSPDERYRLLVLPNDPRPDLEFASLLRSADETMGVVTVAEGSELEGSAIGAMALTVIAVRGPGGEIEALPSRNRTLSPGDTVYALARPEALRRLDAETAAAV